MLYEVITVWYDAPEAYPARVVAAWCDRAVAWWGERVDVRVGSGAFSGRLVGIDEEADASTAESYNFV